MMPNLGPQPLSPCFLSTPPPISMRKKMMQLYQLNQKVQALLPPPLPHQCRVANYRQGILILETASASWLLRLRYEQMRLTSALRQEALPGLTAIEVTINPSFHAVSTTRPSRGVTPSIVCKPISPCSAYHLWQLAQQAPPGLQAILLKLAANAPSKPTKAFS